MQTVQIPKPKPTKPAAGFNPFSLTPEQVREDIGWRLLNEGDAIQAGDGYWHPDYEGWIDYECRPALFDDARVHTWPWRRKKRAR